MFILMLSVSNCILHCLCHMLKMFMIGKYFVVFCCFFFGGGNDELYLNLYKDGKVFKIRNSGF